MVIRLIHMITTDLLNKLFWGFSSWVFFMNVSFFVVWIKFYLKYIKKKKKIRHTKKILIFFSFLKMKIFLFSYNNNFFIKLRNKKS